MNEPHDDQERRILDTVHPLEPSGRVDVRWNHLRARMAANQDSPIHPSAYPPIRPLLRAAAVVAFIALGSGGVWLMNRASRKAPVALVKEARTANAQRLALRLPDGTRVVLAPASRLTYDANTYGRTSRAVQLEGQAYFEVEHDAARPFEVRADGLVARDMGTRFTARAFAGEPAVVAVAEGRVGVGRKTDSVTIAVVEPGQLGTLSAAGNLTVGRNPTPDAFFAWTEGRLVFLDTPLSQALSQLDRWYDVRFKLADRALAQRPLTVAFDTESLSEVLDVLHLTLDLDVSRSGDTVTLAPRGKETR